MIRYVTAETEQYVFCFKALLEFQDTRSLGKLKVGKTVRDEWLKKSEIDVAPWCYIKVDGTLKWTELSIFSININASQTELIIHCGIENGPL